MKMKRIMPVARKHTGAKTCSKFQTGVFSKWRKICCLILVIQRRKKSQSSVLPSALSSSKCHPSYQDILLKSNADIQDMLNGDKVAFLNTEWEDAHLYSFPER